VTSFEHPDGAAAVELPDQIVLRSIGIDVGSATSHMSVAEITLRRLGKAHSGRYVTIGRSLIYESPVIFTPYRPDGSIDADALGRFLQDWFASARVSPDDIDTGAVILTGEALRRDNARAIASLFEDRAGRFVCATAGDLFEVTMAAHGSGAVELSRRTHRPVLNIDIGGGTTKVSVSNEGEIVRRGVLHVGSRLVATDADGRVQRLERAALAVADDLGLPLALGAAMPPGSDELIAERMLDCVGRFLGLAPVDELTGRLGITEPMDPAGTDRVVFSSGVSEYLYGRETRHFGDLAMAMADGIRRRLEQGEWPWAVHDESTGIRATVAGVSQYSVQVSGDTIALAGADSLPWRNLRLVHVDATGADADEIARQMAGLEAGLELATAEGGIAWFIRVSDDRRYQTLKAVADGICAGLRHGSGNGRPQAFIFEADVANSLGHIMLNEMNAGGRIAFLDCISATDVDFVDIGRIVEPNRVVPVIVKTLVF
jgi:ethanolamine utilization protein EutA